MQCTDTAPTTPYFEILVSIPNGNYRTIKVADTVVRAPNDFSNTVVQVPYGFEFTTINSVVDFLLSYGAFQERQGMTFEDKDNARILNWSQMAQGVHLLESPGLGHRQSYQHQPSGHTH
jgi:hypothetical protein